MVAIIMSLAFIIKDFMLKLLVAISFLSANQVYFCVLLYKE